MKNMLNHLKSMNYEGSLNWNLIPRLFWLFMFLFCMVGQGYSQGSKLTFSFENAQMATVIEEIRQQTDINFVYNDEELAKSPLISISVNEMELSSVLDMVFEGSGLKYEVINNTYVIVPNKDRKIQVPKTQEGYEQTLKGRVIDRASKAPLPFATVYIKGSEPLKGTTTDLDGKFQIENLGLGRYTLVANFVGYAEAEIPEIQVGSGREVFVTLELEEISQALGEVVITLAKGEPLNDMATISAMSFSEEETKRYPASISDPARMVQSFAGVATGDDASNEIVIRGNSPNWLQWRMEGIEIPSPNHFAEEGYTAGAVSILSTNTLANSDFYTGAFTSEYGNALSGVFDINMRKGNNEKREYSFQAGVLGLAVSAEGPFKKGYGGSYLLNYRYSTLALLGGMGIQVSENTNPEYQDLSFKLAFPTKNFGTIEVWGIGGYSRSDEEFIPDTAEGDKLDHGYSDLTKSRMYAVGLNHTYFFNKNTFIRTVISQSMSGSSNDVANMDTLGVLTEDYKDDLNKNALRLNSYINQKVSPKLNFRAGVILNHLWYNYDSQSLIDSTKTWKTDIDADGVTNLYEVYATAKYNLSDKVFLTGGLHYSYFEISEDQVIEPRLGLSWSLANRQRIKLGLGMHSRHENLPVYFVQFQDSSGNQSQSNRNLGLTKAAHFVLGYEKMIGTSLKVGIEAYYQHIFDLPVPNNPDKYYTPAFGGVNFDDTLVNEGQGRNYGIELTIQKFFTNRWYFLLSTSLFDSKYKALDGEWRNSRYNLGHILNLVGGKEIQWGDHKMLGLNGRINWTGGKRTTPIDLEQSIADGEAVYIEELAYTEQASDYFRLDIGVKLHFFRQNSEHVIALDIQNVTNRQNTWFQVYDSDKEEIVNYPMAGLIPILSYTVQF